ncbi:MAG: HlyC/CorC family transporter [Symploca sp. SIO3C6]|uniref:HlyC/CorC family transporter n=1 Tax=Symploca sp. SIO1C4 TaxID=2607765 RepID=A0A6B3N447_9CYAN|nr:HlyC/CorC family transporter [Symploca sp. SIO3C6]NER26290.1 HlyC/CorC family transporter [Symploca sp. SIO1C4]NET05529.1 HlyC/CorC family transporter [Symploca sp. SIO2B6]
MVSDLMVLLTASASTSLTGLDVMLRLLSVLLLIALNAFFVTAEFSMVSVRRSRINQLVDAGDVQAKTVQGLQRSIDRLLSTTQLGITLSSLALGWIGESTMAVPAAAAMVELPIPPQLSQMIAHSLAVPVAFFLIAYLQIVLGELCPKSVAMLYSEQLARFLGPPSSAIARFFKPFIWILNQSTRFLLRLVGIQYTGQSWYSRVTPEELQLIITTERESTGLEAEERELLKNVFEFGDVLAAEVMVPRTNIAAIPKNATFQTLLEEIAKTNHSGYPVIGESLDDICGIIYFKELAEPLSQGQLTIETAIAPWIRPARFVPESRPLSELLPLMQRSHLAMVMVVDEFGGTAGLVTLKDLIAEIIGEHPEVESNKELDIKVLDDHTFEVQAQMDLEEVNEMLDLDLPLAEEYQTLAGFLLYQLQKIPVEGETTIYENLELTVVSAQGPRLHQIRIHQRELTAAESTDNSVNEVTPVIATATDEKAANLISEADSASYKDSG